MELKRVFKFFIFAVNFCRVNVGCAYWKFVGVHSFRSLETPKFNGGVCVMEMEVG